MEQRRIVKIRQIKKNNFSRILHKISTTNDIRVLYFKDILVGIAKNANLRKIKRDHVIVWQGQEGKQ